MVLKLWYLAVILRFSCFSFYVFLLLIGAASLNRGLSSFSVGFDNGRASPGRVWLPNSPTHQN